MVFFNKKNLIYFLLSMFVSIGAQAKVLCVADDHVEIESSMTGDCSSTSGDSCQDCTDYEISTESIRTDGVSDQLIDQLKSATQVHLADLGRAFLDFEVNFSPHDRFLHPRRTFSPVSLLEKKVTVLLN